MISATTNWIHHHNLLPGWNNQSYRCHFCKTIYLRLQNRLQFRKSSSHLSQISFTKARSGQYAGWGSNSKPNLPSLSSTCVTVRCLHKRANAEPISSTDLSCPQKKTKLITNFWHLQDVRYLLQVQISVCIILLSLFLLFPGTTAPLAADNIFPTEELCL